MKTIRENLGEAMGMSMCCTTALRCAHVDCKPIESIILLQLIERAATLEKDIKAFTNARGEK